MDIKNAHQNFLREEIQMAAAAGDLDRLVLLLEDMEDLDNKEPTEEIPEVTAPVRRTAPEPTAWEQLGALVLAALAVAFMVALFLALCAAPDHW
jgi:hypothetical protein